VPRGRLLDDKFTLPSRAKKWIAGIRAHYAGTPLTSAADSPVIPESAFKML
jgi:hypothetical protein